MLPPQRNKDKPVSAQIVIIRVYASAGIRAVLEAVRVIRKVKDGVLLDLPQPSAQVIDKDVLHAVNLRVVHGELKGTHGVSDTFRELLNHRELVLQQEGEALDQVGVDGKQPHRRHLVLPVTHKNCEILLLPLLCPPHCKRCGGTIIRGGRAAPDAVALRVRVYAAEHVSGIVQI